MQVSTNILLNNTQKRLVVLLVLLMLSSVKMFGQEKTAVVTIEENSSVVATTNLVAASDSDIDFMNWFMGTKQAQSASNSNPDSTLNTKKQLINSGGSTNRVLYKTLVKKLISIDNALV